MLLRMITAKWSYSVDNPLSSILDSDSAKNKMALWLFVEWEVIHLDGVEIGGSRFYFKHTSIPLMQRHFRYVIHSHAQWIGDDRNSLYKVQTITQCKDKKNGWSMLGHNCASCNLICRSDIPVRERPAYPYLPLVRRPNAWFIIDTVGLAAWSRY